jgi:hypothetical protein
VLIQNQELVYLQVIIMNNIRSGQLLSPFGIGQIVNFPGENSLMICGLNLWDEKLELKRRASGTDSVDESMLRIEEPRLQRKLGVNYFRKPFPYLTTGRVNRELEIPAVRFPGWCVCTNPKCGAMRDVELGFNTGRGGIIECNNNGCKSTMVPVRFVAACRKGHIQDVPFREWVHNGHVPKDNEKHNLKYTAASGSGDLGSIVISCTCKASKTLAGLMNVRKEGNVVFDSALARIGLNHDDENKITPKNPNNNNTTGQYCKGYQPWLGQQDGINNAEPCGEHLQVLIRGASNIHYASIESAIFLPEITEEADKLVGVAIKETNRSLAELKDLLQINNDEYILRIILERTKVVTDNLMSLDDLTTAVIAEIQNHDSGPEEDDNTENIKWEEYQYILKGRNSENADFKAIKKGFKDYLESELLSNFFDSVVLVEKLKETRVFTGFSRINSDNSNREAKMQQLSNSTTITWLPAYEVYGEGVFLKFRDDKIDEWLASFENIPDKLTDRYHSAMLNRGGDNVNRNINRAFIMIHTFAHLLIKRMCFNCGYGSSSLRERIYFSSDPETRMNGILIYTSSGDSEGSMGGLVRQGKEQFLGKLVREALEDARWCSADPVCTDIGKDAGQGPDNVNGAACHNCAIVPETSCEEFNSLLDRSLVVGESSFFGEEF